MSWESTKSASKETENRRGRLVIVSGVAAHSRVLNHRRPYCTPPTFRLSSPLSGMNMLRSASRTVLRSTRTCRRRLVATRGGPGGHTEEQAERKGYIRDDGPEMMYVKNPDGKLESLGSKAGGRAVPLEQVEAERQEETKHDSNTEDWSFLCTLTALLGPRFP